MATTDELIALNDRQVALLFLMDGIAPGFTNDARLVGFDTGADHDVRLGLQIDGLALKIAVDVRAGQFLDCSASLTLRDFTGQGFLASLFAAGSADARQLGDIPFGSGTPVHPLSDLTGRPELDEHNIGTERIGANGARHQYAVPPGFDISLDHSVTVPALDLEGAPVSDNPIVWIGRRWALYMVFRDHVTYPDQEIAIGPSLTSWRPMSEARILSFGAMRHQGVVNGSEITLELDGPDSLLRKPLAAGFTPEPTRAEGDVSLSTEVGENEAGIYIVLSTGILNSYEEYGVRNFAVDITGTTADEIIAEIAAEVAAAAAATGAAGVWNEQAGHHVSMTEDGGISIEVAESVLDPEPIFGGEMYLMLHANTWAIIGYEIAAQRDLFPDVEDPRAVDFIAVSVEAGAPGPGYWAARFVTGGDWTPEGADNGGIPRLYKPMYLGGTAVLLAGLNGGSGQIVRLGDAALGGGASGTTVSHPGQLAWPVPSSSTDPASPIEINGTPCDRCGWWLFLGKRRYAGTEEIYDERWIGFASWVNGSVAEDGLVSGDTIIVTRWMDPRLYGYETKSADQPASDWIGRADATPREGQIQAVPIVMLGYRTDLDLAHVVLQRLLHTTGTCVGWDAPWDDDPNIVGGDNEPAGVPGPPDARPRDAEIASLGLAIPDAWIASPADYAEAVSTIDNPGILGVKVTFIAGYQAEDVCRSLMQPAGLSFHLRGGQFGIWNPSFPLTFADATVTLTRGEARVEKHDEAGTKRLYQGQRKWQPIDTWKIATDWQPYERKVAESIERQAPDAAYRYRPGEVTHSILAHAMRRGGNGLQERLLAQSRWAALPHFEVQGYPVDPVRPGLDCWPGTVGLITDGELWTPDGTQGVTNRIAIITSIARSWSQSEDVDGMVEATLLCDLLVYGYASGTPRLNAPSAQGRGYNSATGRLYLDDDWLEIGNGWSDAATFIESTYGTSFGGNAVIECWQWDGDSWSQTFAATVTSASTTPGDSYLVVTSTSGAYYRDMLTRVVMRPSTIANALWVETLFPPIANGSGEYTDDAAATQPYVPWEA